MQKTLVDFGHSITLPNIEYWQYLARYISENIVVFSISGNFNCKTAFEIINEWTTRYILSNLSNQEKQAILSCLYYDNRFVGYDKTYRVRYEDINDDTVALTLVESNDM